jgi:hypothetical protein
MTHSSDLLIWFVRDSSDILTLRLGPNGGDPGFPPHSWLSHPRYNHDPVCAAIIMHVGLVQMQVVIENLLMKL